MCNVRDVIVIWGMLWRYTSYEKKNQKNNNNVFQKPVTRNLKWEYEILIWKYYSVDPFLHISIKKKQVLIKLFWNSNSASAGAWTHDLLGPTLLAMSGHRAYVPLSLYYWQVLRQVMSPSRNVRHFKKQIMWYPLLHGSSVYSLKSHYHMSAALTFWKFLFHLCLSWRLEIKKNFHRPFRKRIVFYISESILI